MEDLEFQHDNISTMLMEDNGKESITKCTKHIQVRYLFIKYRIDNRYFSLKYRLTGKMYADFFTNSLQGAMFRKFRAMIQGIPNSTLDVYVICPRAMAKVTSQDCVGQNYIQTNIISTASTDAVEGTCTDSHGSLCMDTQTHGSISKDACGSACMDDRGSVCTYISTHSTGVYGITCPYVSTKGTDMYVVTYTDNSMVKTVVNVRTNMYDTYERYKPKRDIGKDILGMVGKRIRYADALHQSS